MGRWGGGYAPVMRIAIALLVGVVGVVGLVGCSPPDVAVTDTMNVPEAPRVGDSVRVQLRRDHLGAGERPIGPTIDVANGTQTSLNGKLQVLTERWVVIDSGKKRHWIARSSVLLLTTEAN